MGLSTYQPDPERLLAEIRTIAANDTANAAGLVRAHLERALASLALSDRLSCLGVLADRLLPPAPFHAQPGDVQRLVARFLGADLAGKDLPPQELADRFGAALDALFDALNQIVSLINVNLLGESPELETIRKVIGSNLKGGEGFGAVTGYLDRIRKAFLVAHTGFQQAAQVMVAQILAELDPGKLLETKAGRLSFGPLRKAELFQEYEEKYGRCKRWFETGQYREQLLREFERQCQAQIDVKMR